MSVPVLLILLIIVSVFISLKSGMENYFIKQLMHCLKIMFLKWLSVMTIQDVGSRFLSRLMRLGLYSTFWFKK